MEEFFNWKWLLRANAKALFFITLLVLLLVLGWCAWTLLRPKNEVQVCCDDGKTRAPVAQAAMSIGIISLMEKNAENADLVFPMNPFRPTLESLAANKQTVIAALKRPWNQHRNATNDPFAQVRAHRNVPGAGNTSGGQPQQPTMQVPVLSYRGFFQRPDGKFAALFNDSSKRSTAFYLPGATIHGVTLVSSTAEKAVLRLPDGTEQELVVGGKIELTAEAQP
jgi:hypothetical protein